MSTFLYTSGPDSSFVLVIMLVIAAVVPLPTLETSLELHCATLWSGFLSTFVIKAEKNVEHFTWSLSSLLVRIVDYILYSQQGPER